MTAKSLPAPAQPTLEYDFEESIGYWIVLSSQAFQKALNDELTPHGITFRQSQVLGWLALEGELSQVELAARMMIEPATLVGILDRMERDQWISRSSTAADRRRKVIRASQQAGEVWSKVACCARRVRAHAVQGLSERQIIALKRSLRIVLENLRDYEASP
jgi:MarR family transcriptional regulator for hemolysin